MKVLKFGGTSVAKSDRILQIIKIVQPLTLSSESVAVVCSAFSGITDMIIELCQKAAHGQAEYLQVFETYEVTHKVMCSELLSHHPESYIQVIDHISHNHETLRDLLKGIFLLREATPRSMDYAMSFGERNSNYIIAAAMRLHGIKAEFLDAREVIKTSDDFGSAKVNFQETNGLINEYFNNKKGNVQVITGFIGSNAQGLTTTLGRGGSDYTAAIFAGALQADVLEIWTDVDGVLTADPRKVKKAFTLPQLSYAEAMEMSHFGAKVIYPPTIQPALAKDIPIYIKNTFNPSFVGTLISKNSDKSFTSAIKGISALSGTTLISLEGTGMIGVPGISGRLFTALGREKVNIILITQASSEHSITFAIVDKEAQKAMQVLELEFQRELEEGLIEPIKIEKDMTVVAVVGENMRHVPGVAGQLFRALGKNGINIMAIAQGSSELNISFVINKEAEIKAINVIHDAFFLSKTKRLHLFMIGTGLIGSTLLRQMYQQTAFLEEQYNLEIVVCGLANSKQMLIDTEGIDLQKWNSILIGDGQKTDTAHFIDKMIECNLSNSVFIDCTASAHVPTHYERILTHSISISTPNKVAASSPYVRFKDLKAMALKHQASFMFETNVGAGLPIISTLRNLIQSGDKILSIEAVLSGSISFIFNNFDGTQPFSALVLEAKEKGYTEPDPRDDLSGSDVMRKITILAREAGLPIEMSDIELSPILPEECMQAEGVEAFFESLKTNDNYFIQWLHQAQSQNGALRFIAKCENNHVSCAVKIVDSNSPFYSLVGSDNMVVYTTERYKSNPLIVRGPGAGAEVTAAGIFAEIISLRI